MIELTIIQKIAVWSLPLLFAITVHEVAHGYVAYRLGDPTAKMLGRLTLNPIKHIDLIGTILVPLLIGILSNFNFVFGWAKPVPVTWQNLKNPRRDMPLVALAGPMTNLIMALGWAIIAKIGMSLSTDYEILKTFLLLTGQAGILINIVLMVLNLVPLPPLDGSRVLASALPPRAASVLDRIEPFSFLIILALLMTGILQMFISPIITLCIRWILQLFNL